MLAESSFHSGSLPQQMGLTSWAWTYSLKVRNQIYPIPLLLCPNFSNGVFKESLHTLDFAVGTWSIFTCNYRLLLSKDKMLHKPRYDYYAQ